MLNLWLAIRVHHRIDVGSWSRCEGPGHACCWNFGSRIPHLTDGPVMLPEHHV